MNRFESFSPSLQHDDALGISKGIGVGSITSMSLRHLAAEAVCIGDRKSPTSNVRADQPQ